MYMDFELGATKRIRNRNSDGGDVKQGVGLSMATKSQTAEGRQRKLENSAVLIFSCQEEVTSQYN